MSKNNAKIIDPNMLIQAGINPSNGLPIKLVDTDSALQKAYLKCFRIKDEQDAINRYVWYNLPYGLNSRLIERILYYRGQGIFFQLNGKFHFLPYALYGSIDVYGRYKEVTPLPFTGVTSTENKEGKEKPWISGLYFKPVYDFISEEEFNSGNFNLDEYLEKSCVIIKDYSEQYSQTNISRQILQEPLLNHMSEIPCFARTALLNSTGIVGVKIQNENESSQIYDASAGITKAALTGRKYIPIVGSVEYQELTGGNVAKAEEFLVELESLDNLRLSMYGIPNGGIFQKKAHMLESEAQLNVGASDLALQDGLNYRQEACDLINSIWGLGVSVEINPTLLGTQLMAEDMFSDEQVDESNNEEVEGGFDDAE